MAQPVSGHVYRFEGKRRPTWRAKYRLPDGRQVKKVMGNLEKKGLLKRVLATGKAPKWQVTPLGRARAMELADDMDLAALAAEAARRSVTMLGDTPHPVIPPSLAPPELIAPLRSFFQDHPLSRVPQFVGER